MMKLIAACEKCNQCGAGILHGRTEMKVSFLTCHSRCMKFSKSYLSSVNRQRK